MIDPDAVFPHELPEGEPAPFFVFNVDLGPVDMDGRWEQIMGRRIGLDEVSVLTVPFFAPFAVGDTIKMVDHPGNGWMFDRVTGRSGRTVVRVVILDASAVLDVEQVLAESGRRWEHDHQRWYAVDMAPGEHEALTADLAPLERAGLIYFGT